MPRRAWITILLIVSGCAHAPAPRAPVAATGCGAVAMTRMKDAAANNYEPEMQQVIYRGTYQDCLAWQGKASDTTNIGH